jgi:hypothetical protein
MSLLKHQGNVEINSSSFIKIVFSVTNVLKACSQSSPPEIYVVCISRNLPSVTSQQGALNKIKAVL